VRASQEAYRRPTDGIREDDCAGQKEVSCGLWTIGSGRISTTMLFSSAVVRIGAQL
jgi:hypothetical protein